MQPTHRMYREREQVHLSWYCYDMEKMTHNHILGE